MDNEPVLQGGASCYGIEDSPQEYAATLLCHTTAKIAFKSAASMTKLPEDSVNDKRYMKMG